MIIVIMPMQCITRAGWRLEMLAMSRHSDMQTTRVPLSAVRSKQAIHSVVVVAQRAWEKPQGQFVEINSLHDTSQKVARPWFLRFVCT